MSMAKFHEVWNLNLYFYYLKNLDRIYRIDDKLKYKKIIKNWNRLFVLNISKVSQVWVYDIIIYDIVRQVVSSVTW